MTGLGLNRKATLVLLLVFVVGCTSTYCRQSYRDKDGNIRSTHAEVEAVDQSKSTVDVYKYDGSLQCGLGQAISLDEMAKQLAPIKIIRQQKKNDGLMHITVCGSTTGAANVYTISLQDLEKAKLKKFKLWSF